MGRSLMSSRLFPTTGALIGSLVCLLISSFSAHGSDYTCSVEQVSHTSDRQIGARAVAFSENGRQAIVRARVSGGSGPFAVKPELFQVDLATGEFTRLTRIEEETFSREITADGRLARIIFVSDRNLTDENPEQVSQLFLFTSEDRQLFQLTHFTNSETQVLSPTISGDGSRVAFLANANPLGSNRDLSREIFLIDLNAREISQISRLTHLTIPSDPTLSHDGKKLAYLLTHPLSDFSEIDLIDFESGEARLIYTADRLASPILTSDGSSIFFVTDIDPEGFNLDRSLEIFRIDLGHSDGSALSADQLSDFVQIKGSSFDNLKVSGNGQRIVFRSQLDLTDWNGEGADNLYLFDITESRLEQLTLLRGFNEPSSELFVDKKGERVLFSSRANLADSNSDGNIETFIVGCQDIEVYFFPQIGDGRAGEIQFRTSFILANTGPDTDVEIDFFSNQGEPLLLDLSGLGRRERAVVQMRKGTPFILSTRGLAGLKVGFARVRASSGIAGTAVFTGSNASTKTTLYEAAVPLAAPISEFSVVVNTRGHYQTGLAMVNPPAVGNSVAGLISDSESAEILLRLYDDDFNLLGQRVVVLAQGHHQSSFVAQLFPQIPQAREMIGLLTAKSSRPLAVVTLRYRDDPTLDFPADVPNLTTLPVAPGIPDDLRSPDAIPQP